MIKIDKQRLTQVLDAVSGLSYFEWRKIRSCVDDAYNSAINRVELTDTELLEVLLVMEFNIAPQEYFCPDTTPDEPQRCIGFTIDSDEEKTEAYTE